MKSEKKIEGLLRLQKACDELNEVIDELIRARIDRLDRELQKQVKDTLDQARGGQS